MLANERERDGDFLFFHGGPNGVSLVVSSPLTFFPSYWPILASHRFSCPLTPLNFDFPLEKAALCLRMCATSSS